MCYVFCFLPFCFCFTLIIVYKGFKKVQQSKVMVIERLGKYNRTLHSGINIIIPLIDDPIIYLAQKPYAICTDYPYLLK